MSAPTFTVALRFRRVWLGRAWIFVCRALSAARLVSRERGYRWAAAGAVRLMVAEYETVGARPRWVRIPLTLEDVCSLSTSLT